MNVKLSPSVGSTPQISFFSDWVTDGSVEISFHSVEMKGMEKHLSNNKI